MPHDSSQIRTWLIVFMLSIATMLSMSLWFSATAVVDSLEVEWQLSRTQIAWLTMTVQIGFVIGAIGSALLNLADRISPRVLFLLGSLVGAAANAAIAIWDGGYPFVLGCRVLTGACCALIYPVGMRIMTTWTQRNRGLGLGLLVGAVVIGSALPHLIRALGGISQWQLVFYIASLSATIGGFTGLASGALGPYRVKTPPFRWRHMSRSLLVRPLRLANLGYLGHMWELYAMWTWLPTFLAASFAASEAARDWSDARIATTASLVGFVAIAGGGLGSLLAGIFADRMGRTTLTILSLALSGGCCLVIGFSFGAAPWIVIVISLVWGFAVVADSAQFSSCISELSEPEYVGTQLTTQTAFGFLLTLSTIQMVPFLLEWTNWRWVFVPLVLGPIVGILAMWRLRTSPESQKLAGGNK